MAADQRRHRGGHRRAHGVERGVGQGQVAGITELRSISGTGTSFVIITFDLSRDIDTAAQDVRDRVAVEWLFDEVRVGDKVIVYRS